ncbi:MAG: hypothetical protein AAF405_09525, partial [Pseudomonadota bacterium]
MHGQSSDNKPRSRALVPVARSLPPAAVRPRGVDLKTVPQGSGRSAWSRWLTLGAGLAVGVAVLLASANALAPSKWAEARAIAWIKAASGYDLEVKGGTELSFMPAPRIEMTDAKITSAHANGARTELSVPKLTIDFGLPAFIGDVSSFAQIALERPVLSLHPEGVQQAALRLRGTEVRPTTQPDVLALSQGLRIEELRVYDGTVLIHSKKRTQPRRIERINAEAALPDMR